MSVKKYVVYSSVGQPCFGGKKFRTVDKAMRYTQRKFPALGLISFLGYYVKEVAK